APEENAGIRAHSLLPGLRGLRGRALGLSVVGKGRVIPTMHIRERGISMASAHLRLVTPTGKIATVTPRRGKNAQYRTRARTHKSSSMSGSPRHRPPLCNRSKCRDGATRDIDQPEWRWSPDILVYPPILHDDLEVLGGVGDQVDILQWIAVDQQQIGKRALFHDAELAGIGIAFAGQCQQFGVGSGCHCERFGGTVPADERGQNCPLLLRQRLGEQDIGAPRRLDLVFLRQLVGSGYARPDFISLGSLDRAYRKALSQLLGERLRT